MTADGQSGGPLPGEAPAAARARPGGPPGELDLLVVGSGVAGLSAAVRAAASEPGMRIGVVSKAALADSATRWAQGGVAAVLDEDEADVSDPADSPALHIADTLAAGAGLCDQAAVEVLIAEGPARVRELAALGARFDRTPHGVWELAREGGHSRARVVHAGGAATGAEIERTLVAAAREAASTVWEGWFALDLLVEEARCRGVRVLTPGGEVVELRARHTLLATGGAGQLYAVTTNPPQSSGDGIAMALRAGVPVADVEFVQFHPTALHGATAGPRPLLSEALRGEGAFLRDRRGRRFVDELSPRDVVAAAMAARMRADDVDHLWLDATGVEAFARRFPTLAEAVRAQGLDPARDWLPVAPAAHYLCGGVLTDLDGATALPGLWAAGEVADSGVHGANRLASNSLLEGMVYGARVVEAVARGREGPTRTGALWALDLSVSAEPDRAPGGAPAVTGPDAPGRVALRRLPPRPAPGWRRVDDPAKAREELQRAMTNGAGVTRSAGSLATAGRELAQLAAPGPVPQSAAAGELSNLVTVAEAVVGAALVREESRGGHRRSDHPHPAEAYAVRLVQ